MTDSSKLTSEELLLAAIAYGESSTRDQYEEMAALASVMVRQMKARGYSSIDAFTSKDKNFSFVRTDGNARYARLMKSTEKDVEKSSAMSDAVKAARNALSGGVDYSNGAYFWDGADIKSNYKNHAKVKSGIHFTDPAHNIYGINGSEKTKILYRTVKKKANGHVKTGARQGSCRLSHAANGCISFVCDAMATTESRSGLSVTAPMGVQLRVLPDQRAGLRSRA